MGEQRHHAGWICAGTLVLRAIATIIEGTMESDHLAFLNELLMSGRHMGSACSVGGARWVEQIWTTMKRMLTGTVAMLERRPSR